MGEAYRIGGDEFMILLPNVFIDEAEKLANGIIERSKDNSFVGKSIEAYGYHKTFIDSDKRITCSIGITSTEKNIDIDKLINIADHSMFEAKGKGKNQYVIKSVECEMR